MSTRSDFALERAALRATLIDVGPDAPTTCDAWTATDLAVHIVLAELGHGAPNAPFRLLVAAGVRLDRMAGGNTALLSRSRRRHGFNWAMGRLASAPPRLLGAGPIASVSLLEVWAHHEDLLAANGRLHDTGVDLGPALRVLVRYHRSALAAHAIRVVSAGTVWREPKTDARASVEGPPAAITRWLSGRAGLGALTVTGSADAIAELAALSLRI
ncbi:MAG: maleylpyruvate isomerase family mycothiol-dependent enzyme [Acidimicrobiales bacterium]